MEKVFLIENFYKKNIGLKPKIAVVGLNPHCETSGVYNEDDQIIKPSIKHLQKKIIEFKVRFLQIQFF